MDDSRKLTNEVGAPISDNIKYRHAAHCFLADPEYGMRLAAALALDQARVEELAGLTEAERLSATSAESWR